MERSRSRKSYRGGGNGYSASTFYDDVFTGSSSNFGAPTLTPAVDYNEIFGSFHDSRDSSIPILSIPPVDHASEDFCFDVSSSRFDYSEVFGGNDDVDFGVPYEELFGGSKGGDDDSDDDDVWSPAQSESLSDESDPFTSFERNQCLSHGDINQSYGGRNQLKVSHSKATTKTEEDIPSGTGHITHFHAVPGFIGFINEAQTSRNTVDENLPLHEGSDLNNSKGGRVTQENLRRKTKLHSSNTESGRGTYERNLNPLLGHEKQCSDGTRPQLSVSDISMKTHPSQLPPPSRPPPALTVHNKDTGRLNSKLKASKNYASEQIEDTLPTFFDVEIDASSSAAVSAAAMKDAVEKAQVKLRNAKESMERKKGSHQSRLKLSDTDLNEREEMQNTMNDKSSSLRNERMLGRSEGEDSRMRHHTREASDKLKKTAGTTEGQNQTSVSGNSVESKYGKECKSSLGLHKTENNVKLREELQFHQALEENHDKDAKVLNQNTKSRDQEHNTRSTVEVFEQQEGDRNRSTISDTCEWEKQNLSQVPNYTRESDVNMNRSMSHKNYHLEEHLTKANMGLQDCELKDKGKELRGSQQLDETGKILKDADEIEECENLIEIQLKEDKVEYEETLNGACKRLASEEIFKYTSEKQDHGQAQNFDSKHFFGIEEAVLQADNKRSLKKSEKQDATEKHPKEGSEREKTEKTQKDHERGGSERGVVQQQKLEVDEKRFKEVFELERSEGRSKVIIKSEGNVLNPVPVIHENEEMVRESRKQENNQYKLEKVQSQEKNTSKQKRAGEGVENENIVSDNLENEEDGKRSEAWSPEERKRSLQKGLVGEKSIKVAFKEEGYEKKVEARIGTETKSMVQDVGDMKIFREHKRIHEKVDMEENGCRMYSEKNLKVSDGAFVTDSSEVPLPTDVYANDTNIDYLEISQELLSCNGCGESGIDRRECEREAEAVVVPDDWIDKATTESEEFMDSCHSHHTESISNDVGIGIVKSNIENDKQASEMAPELSNTNILAPNQVDEGKNKENQCTAEHKRRKDEFTCPQSQGQQDGKKMVDDLSGALQGKQRIINTSALKGKGMGKEDENCKSTLTAKEKEKHERLKRERELENERLRKIEEERERQREREKDMMSIDRATLEACERAFFENRERVKRPTIDRAAAEVQQRALAEAREKLEKACAEARERTLAGRPSIERLFAGKASMEARLRAERVAVDRAAAQARERAEKATAENSSLEARERGERSVAEKISASSRSSMMRQNSSSSDLLDSKFQSAGSSNVSRFSHVSTHGEGETESPQRCKARSERHHRTAERAQKALAEKNMRDLLAQKEQAERHRLAEGLDAEVKRWCRGKEGNLRALLSTLQYILGPDSGWQPVPLTDVITTVAVKKAYRKATLCVHPDKLQQRGATIHQKYICEKVYDLLKEAWTKFNSEER